MSHDQEHAADPQASRPGYIVGNDHALPYLSKWSREMASVEPPEEQMASAEELPKSTEELPEVLKHMNCSYFSTPGQPPTLLALKQHAQSLAHAISVLCPSIQPAAGEINLGEGGGADKNRPIGRAIEQGEAMDWLRSLTEPYKNDNPTHHRLLYSLLNEVKRNHDVLGTTYHCPLEEYPDPRQPGEKRQPYDSHHNLLMHANACLERLDHEFGATGGLLSILPTVNRHDTDEMDAARNTLLGQWLFFTQTLVGRMHELELAYANALDVLRGEAVAPSQHLSELGPDARAVGRAIGYPQDRWVLANAGEDVFEYLHTLLDRKEAVVAQRDEVYRDRGAMGDHLWVKDAQKSYARGIVHFDVMTRFYRLKGQGGDGKRSTIFVLPAWDVHPGTQHTKVLETYPKVVTVPAPLNKLPEPASVLQERARKELEKAAKTADDNKMLVAKNENLEARLKTVEQELKRQYKTNAALQACIGPDKAKLAKELNRLRRGQAESDGAADRLAQMRRQWEATQAAVDEATLARVEELKELLAAEKKKLAAVTLERDQLKAGAAQGE